jgi:hypothetical protein
MIIYLCLFYSSYRNKYFYMFSLICQLMTILEENLHSFLIVEHDPMLYEDAKQMVEYVGQALKHTSREATILLYSPGAGSPPADNNRVGRPGVLHLRRGESTGEGRAKMPGDQATLEAYS